MTVPPRFSRVSGAGGSPTSLRPPASSSAAAEPPPLLPEPGDWIVYVAMDRTPWQAKVIQVRPGGFIDLEVRELTLRRIPWWSKEARACPRRHCRAIEAPTAIKTEAGDASKG